MCWSHILRTLRVCVCVCVCVCVSFMDYDMAYFDMESSRVQALENPFGPKVLGM